MITALLALLPCRVLAFDCRGHGETKSENDQDLSLETLAKDLASLVEMNRDGAKEIILVGHRYNYLLLLQLDILQLEPSKHY